MTTTSPQARRSVATLELSFLDMRCSLRGGMHNCSNVLDVAVIHLPAALCVNFFRIENLLPGLFYRPLPAALTRQFVTEARTETHVAISFHLLDFGQQRIPV